MVPDYSTLVSYDGAEIIPLQPKWDLSNNRTY